MRVIAVIGMIIGLVLVFAVFFNSMVEMDRPFWEAPKVASFDEDIYLVGGLLLFFLSAILFSIRSLIDAVEKNTTNVSSVLYYVSQESAASMSNASTHAEAATPVRDPGLRFSKPGDNPDFPRKNGETDGQYWGRVERDIRY